MPSPDKKMSHSFNIPQDRDGMDMFQPPFQRNASALPLPLTTSKLANQMPRESPKKKARVEEYDVLGVLMAKLDEQQQRQNSATYAPQSEDSSNDDNSSVTTDPFASGTPLGESTSASDSPPDLNEVDRLKKQLELATERMAQMDIELTQTRLAHQTVEQAIGSPYPAAQDIPYAPYGTSQPTFSLPLSRHTSPFDHNSRLPAFGIAPLIQGSLIPAPALYNATNESSFGRPTSGYGGRVARQSGYTPPITPLVQNFPPNHGMPAMQAPVGTRLSPTASSFSSSWQPVSRAVEPVSYMSTTEPLNYRRLLERDMSCNWRYIVDKIVCSNDQQASIFLQQKLKVGTTEQKHDIVQAIIDQAYPLMINRFGNFLVQRCFEHGTPEQIVAIAQAIRGNTLNLSMDAFGCHVIQKAFDSVPEEYKAIMVHELLRRIPETVIHRYACHVWQKLFELRWSDSPPQIMKYVNEALRGMWHEVALGETGSLVVQNIFENCLEEDKRPCVDEVLASVDVVAHGQFGNWCIQHICEHGAPTDRARAVDHVLRFATEYSMDQFASKVVEKCLKIGGTDFLDRYLDRVCEARLDRPRMPLVDISGDQFGNYLIQYILTNADPQRKDVVAGHVRKHMVSLRGSKYGSRVAMLCCNPAYATRPGPPTGMQQRTAGRYIEHPVYESISRPFQGDRGYVGMGRTSYNGFR